MAIMGYCISEILKSEDQHLEEGRAIEIRGKSEVFGHVRSNPRVQARVEDSKVAECHYFKYGPKREGLIAVIEVTHHRALLIVVGNQAVDLTSKAETLCHGSGIFAPTPSTILYEVSDFENTASIDDDPASDKVASSV